MEYPSQNDFLMYFKAIYNNKKEFSDYMLINVSENFKQSHKDYCEHAMGKRFSELLVEDRYNPLGLTDIYYHMFPGSKGKFEKYIENLDCYYFINVYGEDGNSLLITFTDITKLKAQIDKEKKII